uniref:hypothetical protein n=1 Tax=Aquipuribacter sp. SD81 TaxID=3127703 RepID=UPI00301623BC
AEAVLSALAVATYGDGRAVVAPARAARAPVPAAMRRGAGRIAATSVSSRAAAGLPASASARTTIGALTGRPAVAGLSRNQARAALSASRRAGNVQPVAPFRSALADVRAFPGQLRAVRDGAGDALRALRPGSPAQAADLAAWRRSLGLGDDIGDLGGLVSDVRAAHPGLRASSDVRPHLVRAGVLTGVSATAFGTQVGLDTSEVVELFLPTDDPVERLRLPAEP